MQEPIVEATSNKDETKNRIEVVGKQYEVEKLVAKSTKGAAVFVVPSILTPLFISPEAVIFDELFKLKPGYEKAIPEGLIPEEKLKDPAQLSTVLARVLAVVEMLNSGINIIVLHVDAERKKADKKMGFVDKKQVLELMNKYPKKLSFTTISDADYQRYKDKVCAATYCYNDGTGSHTVGIDATQINSATTSQNWGIRTAQEAKDKLAQLDLLLSEYHLLSTNDLKDLVDVALINRPAVKL